MFGTPVVQVVSGGMAVKIAEGETEMEMAEKAEFRHLPRSSAIDLNQPIKQRTQKPPRSAASPPQAAPGKAVTTTPSKPSRPDVSTPEQTMYALEHEKAASPAGHVLVTLAIKEKREKKGLLVDPHCPLDELLRTASKKFRAKAPFKVACYADGAELVPGQPIRAGSTIVLSKKTAKRGKKTDSDDEQEEEDAAETGQNEQKGGDISAGDDFVFVTSKDAESDPSE